MAIDWPAYGDARWDTKLLDGLRLLESDNVNLLPAGDGVTDMGATINATIAAADPGTVVKFPGGDYVIEEPVLLRAGLTYYGPAARLVQKAGTELDALVLVDPAEAYPRRAITWIGIKLDGNAVDPDDGTQTNNTIYTAGSGYAKNKGMVLEAVQFSNFIDLAVRGCGNDGLTVTGDDQWDFTHQGSTNHFLSPYIYGNGGRGVVFGPYADDNHIYAGDIGDNNFAGVHFGGGSSSIRDCTVWGSRSSSGVVVGASSNQIVGCQIEGHAQHGVAVLTRYASYTQITGNKIYDNSNEHTGWYDGVYVSGDPGYVNTAGAVGTQATVKFYPRGDYDYSGGNAVTFTLNEGSGAQTVALNANYGHLAATVTAVDAALSGVYTVDADTGYVRVRRTATGVATITVGGADATAVTGATGYPHAYVRYVSITGNKIYAGIGDFYLDGSHNVDPSLWVGQRRAISFETSHEYCTVDGNEILFTSPGAGAVDPGGTVAPIELAHGGPDPTVLPLYGLADGDTYNGVYWKPDAEARDRHEMVPGALTWNNYHGWLQLATGPSRDRVERVLTTGNDLEAGYWTLASGGLTYVDLPLTLTRFDTSYTPIVTPSWDTTVWVTNITTSAFRANFGTPGAGGATFRYAVLRYT